MEQPNEYHITPRDPAPPETLTQMYQLNQREFEVIRLLRRFHFLDGGRRRKNRGILEWEGIHPAFFPCEPSTS